MKEKRIPPIIKKADDSVRYCPETVTVNNIQTHPGNISPVPGYTSEGLGNMPVLFKFLRTGMNSHTSCYCEYELGGTAAQTGLLARLRIDLAGYSSCNAGSVDKPGGGKVDVIKLLK